MPFSSCPVDKMNVNVNVNVNEMFARQAPQSSVTLTLLPLRLLTPFVV